MPNEELMESHSHGRYFAQYARVTHEMDLQEQLQGLLDAAERKEWHLAGVAGGCRAGLWSTSGIPKGLASVGLRASDSRILGHIQEVGQGGRRAYDIRMD